MRRSIAVPVLLAMLSLPAYAAGPYYARGGYYAGTAGVWGVDQGNQLFDDGLHGDGAANDGVYGAYVISDQPAGVYGFKLANPDWSEVYPLNPSYPTSNAVVWTDGPGDTVHFTLDINAVQDGWQPSSGAVATDQFAPPGTMFEVIGSAPETGSWNSGVAAELVGSVWRTTLTIADPGSYAFKFRAVGTWDICNFGIHYNMFIGDNFSHQTVNPNTTIRFEMDVATGRGRALDVSSTPARSASWGDLKQLYR